MARETRAAALARASDEIRAEDAGRELFALLASGQNPDASEFHLMVEEYVSASGLWTPHRRPDVFKTFASASITAGTGATIWTPASGKKVRLMGFLVAAAVAGGVLFADNAVGTVIARTPNLQANVISPAVDLGQGVLLAAANNVLKLDVTATGNVSGLVWGTEE